MKIPTLDKRNERVLLWAVFAAYVLLLLMALAKHELWGDEIHSWNIARSSTGLLDLLHNSRYEGHPPLWYVVLFTITRITHDPESMKIAQAVFAIAMVYLVLFRSPFPVFIRALIPFGYYFAFEYGALSRNYAIALVLAFLLAWLLLNRPRQQKVWFYVLVFLLANTHLLGLLLALSFCAYHAWQERSAPGTWRRALMHLVIGGLICLPSALQIAPPGDSQLNLRFWLDIWTDRQWDIIAQAPLKAFVPMPETNELHFWNTNTLVRRILEGAHGVAVVRWCAVLLLAVWFFLLRKVRGSMVFMATNVLLTAAVAFLFPLTSARYVGFIWIGFLIASWLYLRERPLGRVHQLFLSVVLIIHVIAGAFAPQQGPHAAVLERLQGAGALRPGTGRGHGGHRLLVLEQPLGLPGPPVPLPGTSQGAVLPELGSGAGQGDEAAELLHERAARAMAKRRVRGGVHDLGERSGVPAIAGHGSV